MFAKAPALVWSLIALTCFLIGAYLGEVRHQAVLPPVIPTVGVALAVEVSFEPTPTPLMTPIPAFTPTPTPWPERIRN